MSSSNRRIIANLILESRRNSLTTEVSVRDVLVRIGFNMPVEIEEALDAFGDELQADINYIHNLDNRTLLKMSGRAQPVSPKVAFAVLLAHAMSNIDSDVFKFSKLDMLQTNSACENKRSCGFRKRHGIK